MSSSSPLIWFQLLDSTAEELYKGTSAVSLPPGSVIAQFRDAVKAKHANKLFSVVSGDLLVYENKYAYVEGKHKPLKSSCPLDGLGNTEEVEDMLLVVVPSSRPSSQSSSESSLTSKEANPKRKQRWIELNAVLERNAKKSKTSDSTAYSNITWNQVERVLNPLNDPLPRRDIDDAPLNFLAQYLSITTKCFGGITTGKEAKRLHFIAPILLCVCNLFNGDVDIVVEHDLVGNFVKAHGHFEFMLRRGKKAVCLVLAKKDNIEEGVVQYFVGCEVAAEVGGLDIVYGIVTNYVQWNFLRSLNDKVEMEECSLRLTPNGPERESLKEIAEKIYAMLSDE